MNAEDFNLFDIAACIGVVYATRAGYQHGFAESMWAMLRWSFVVAAGALSWFPLSRGLTDLAGIPFPASATFCYLAVGFGTVALVESIRRVLGPRILLLIPAGSADRFFGIFAGAIAGIGAALVFFIVVSAFNGDTVDWHPVAMNNNDAIGELTRAIFATIRHNALETSWCGRALQEHFNVLLLQAPSPSPLPSV